MTVLACTQRDLDALGDEELSRSSLAAAALELARQMDGENSATSKSMCAGRLQEVMRELRDLAPVKSEGDGIDQLADRRASRRLSA